MGAATTAADEGFPDVGAARGRSPPGLPELRGASPPWAGCAFISGSTALEHGMFASQKKRWTSTAPKIQHAPDARHCFSGVSCAPLPSEAAGAKARLLSVGWMHPGGRQLTGLLSTCWSLLTTQGAPARGKLRSLQYKLETALHCAAGCLAARRNCSSSRSSALRPPWQLQQQPRQTLERPRPLQRRRSSTPTSRRWPVDW